MLLRSEPLSRRWAVWSRRIILAGIAAWMIAMVPWFFYLIRGMWEHLQSASGHGVSPQQSSFPANAFLPFVGRHPKLLSLGSALCGAALGVLGFPACRAVKRTDAKSTAKSDSPE